MDITISEESQGLELKDVYQKIAEEKSKD